MNAAAVAPTVGATADSSPAASGVSETVEFPADTRTLPLSAGEFAARNSALSRFTLRNDHSSILHVRLAPSQSWISVTPDEVALGPGERQAVHVHTDTVKAREAAREGAGPAIPIHLHYQRIYPAVRGVPSPQTVPPTSGAVFLNLPIATCPACKRHLDEAIATGEAEEVPEVCPYCYERLRPCPACGALNSWLARRCVRDEKHIVRTAPDWGMLGGTPAHSGSLLERSPAGLSRRWSYPGVAPARREARLSWSAPVAAYGLVAAAAATADGDAHLYAFDAFTGAPLWDPYPLPDPVYPDRGGAAIAGGNLYAATVEGACVAVDAQRGTRIWETILPGCVYGSVIPASDDGPLLVPIATEPGAGALIVVDSHTGKLLHQIALTGPPDSAPAFAKGRIFVHDDRGILTAIDLASGEVRWTAHCGAGFDAAPVVTDEFVYSATSTGVALCHRTDTGEKVWELPVTNAPFGGTPALDGNLLYLPADDGLHLVGANAGKAVRRYPVRQPVRSAPVVAGGTLFFGATDGNVYGAAPGRPLEKLYETGSVGSQIIAAPAFADGALFVVATNGVLYSLTVTGGAGVGH